MHVGNAMFLTLMLYVYLYLLFESEEVFSVQSVVKFFISV